MERVKLREDIANDLVKGVLINHYGYDEPLEISRYIGDDGMPYYTASGKTWYHGEMFKTLIPLRFSGYINHLKIALREIGYEDIGWIDVVVREDVVKYEFDARLVNYGKKHRKDNKRSKNHGLYLRRKNS